MIFAICLVAVLTICWLEILYRVCAIILFYAPVLFVASVSMQLLTTSEIVSPPAGIGVFIVTALAARFVMGRLRDWSVGAADAEQ